MDYWIRDNRIWIVLVFALYILTVFSSIFAIGVFYDYYILGKRLFSTLFLCLLGIVIPFCKFAKTKWNIDFQKINILFFTGISTIISIVALFQIYVTKTWCTPNSPLVTFDNTAGVVACLIALLPYILYLACRQSRIIGGVIFLLITFVLLSVKSRSGGIALVVVSSFYMFVELNGSKYRKKKYFFQGITIILFLLLSCLFIPLKYDSAMGRLLIWIVSAGMIIERPLTGYGVGGFDRYYMDYQAKYFETYPNSRFLMVADNVKCPFNEYIHFLVDFGILGLLALVSFIIFVCFLYSRSHSQYKNVYTSSILGLSIVACFSYPSLYPFTYIITIISVIGLSFQIFRNYIQRNRIWKYVRICVFVLSFTTLSYIAKRTYYEHLLTMYIEYGKRTSLNSFIKESRYYLFDKARVAYESGNFPLSAKMLRTCLDRRADYNLNLHIGEVYINMNQLKEARQHLTKAHYMCPSRFYPLYYLAIINEKEHNKKEMRDLCREIINKPVKIYSQDVLIIKHKARLMIRNNK